MKGLRKLPDLNLREREIVALRANGFELKEIAKEYSITQIPEDLDKAEQTIKNVSRRARQKWSADDDDRKMTPDRFLALAIVTGQIVWDGPIGKFVALEEVP